MGLVSGTDAWPRRDRPPGNVCCGLGLVDGWLSSVDAHLGGKRSDSRPRCSLRRRNSALPPIHRRERHAKALGKLLLRQVQPSADGL